MTSIPYKGRRLYVYVSGPLTMGDPIVNTRRAIEVAEELRHLGFVPFVPHLTLFWEMFIPHMREYWMDMDFDWVVNCDALLRMPGESPGADREVDCALANKVAVFFDIESLLEWRSLNDSLE